MTTKQIHRTRAALAFGLMLNGVKEQDITTILYLASVHHARALINKGRRQDRKTVKALVA